MVENNSYTTSLSRTTVSTRRRECRSPRLANVTRRSASGRSRFALVSVVWIRPCLNSDVARFASISRSCAGLPPRRGPLVGVGISAPQLLFPAPGGPGGKHAAGRAEPQAASLELLGLSVVIGVVVDLGERVDHVGRVERGRRVL